MTDKERFEELAYNVGISLDGEKALMSSDDYDFLYNYALEQSERVQELELEVNDWREEVQKWQKFYKESEESHSETKELLYSTISEIKRYKQFIEQFAYCDEDYEGMLRLQNKAKKLIEGENRD